MILQPMKEKTKIKVLTFDKKESLSPHFLSLRVRLYVSVHRSGLSIVLEGFQETLAR